jgi:hypothetical protein
MKKVKREKKQKKDSPDNFDRKGPPSEIWHGAPQYPNPALRPIQFQSI